VGELLAFDGNWPEKYVVAAVVGGGAAVYVEGSDGLAVLLEIEADAEHVFAWR
jgi:hypothetical protein